MCKNVTFADQIFFTVFYQYKRCNVYAHVYILLQCLEKLNQ